jgi:hypothetical protein
MFVVELGRAALVIALVCACMAGGAIAQDEVSASQVDGAEPGSAAAAGDTAVADPGAAAAEEGETEQRLEALESKVDVIANELTRAVSAASVPEDDSDMRGFHGLGWGASKVYRREKGLSIGSYGEVRLRTWVTDQNDGKGGKVRNDDVFDALRAVIYLGYRFNDKWVVNSEFEFEHAGTGGGGSVSTEFVTVDYIAREEIAGRVGLLLIPMGFVNEIHEPNAYFGAARPEVERQIIPSTWRENGGGIFGRLWDRVEYRMYGVNGLEATGFRVDGLRGGRQKGSRAIANNWAFVGRIDVDVLRGFMLGGSLYAGLSGQNASVVRCTSACDTATPGLTSFQVPGTPTFIYEVHAEYKRYGVSFRALFTQAFLDEVDQLNFALGNSPTSQKSVAKQMLGWYAEIGYDVLPLIFKETKMSFEPFFRYERLDTQNVMGKSINGIGVTPNLKYVQDIYTVGASFKPIPQIVFKLDYRNIRPKSDPDDVADQVQASVGYVF